MVTSVLKLSESNRLVCKWMFLFTLYIIDRVTALPSDLGFDMFSSNALTTLMRTVKSKVPQGGVVQF